VGFTAVHPGPPNEGQPARTPNTAAGGTQRRWPGAYTAGRSVMAWIEWEDGSVKLPAAEYVRVRQEVMRADQSHKDKVLSIARDFWRTLDDRETTDRSAYFRAQRDYFRIHATDSAIAQEILEDGFESTSLWGQERPRGLLRADLDYPTEDTNAFNVGRAQIAFDPAPLSARWSVPAGREAAELAHRHSTARTFFEALRHVLWTPGTGGWIEGNDETNRDYGAGGVLRPAYISVAWGPRGADAYPASCEPYRDGSGRQITREALDAH